jgi:hypothetical protein
VYVGINKTFYWQSNHCLTSYLEDFERAKEIIRKAKQNKGEISE